MVINNHIEQLQPEVFLPPSSPLGPGTLLISRDGDEDVSSVRISTTRTSTTDIEYTDANKMPSGRLNSIPKNSNNQEHKDTGCDLLVMLKSCWSWFCGLDDSNDNDEHDESLTTNKSYQNFQRKTVNNDVNEGNASMLQHMKERPLIKWILNGNLVFLILVEIALFVVFSIPAKYTFLRD